MQISGQIELSFLASSSNPPEDGFFQGYCFVGNDLVFGAEGAQRFQAAYGRKIPPAQDGCYVVAQKYGDNYVFDVDFAGYAVLYYYHDGRTWGVSNSFSRIVDLLRTNGERIRPNYVHIAAANGRRMALGQLFSLETMVHGIQVVPRTHSLIISPNGANLVRREPLTQRFDNYDEALSNYLETWVSRFETLMQSDDADFTVSLSGGVDSRTNFALAQAAVRRLGSSAGIPKFRSSGGPANREDLKAAKGVARHFGFQVNDGRDLERIYLSADDGFKVYRELTMGVYFALYLPSQAPTPMNITIGGGGGGLHRNTYASLYKTSEPDDFFRSNAKLLKRPEYEEEFIGDGQQFLATTSESGEDPLRVLLREGRVRFHSGRTPRTEVSFTPLYSGAAEETQMLAGVDRLEQGQLNYDIMHSIDPDLADLPYDDARKSPTSEVKKNLLSAHLHTAANPGKVWTSRVSGNRKTEGAAIAPYKQAFDSAISNSFVTKFWGTELVQEAKKLMDLLVRGESIGNPAKGTPISVVLATDLVTPN